MQFQSFHWLSGHGISDVMPCACPRNSSHYLSSSCPSCKTKSARSCNISWLFNKTIIIVALVGYKVITANPALRALLVIYHLIFPTRTCGKIVKFTVKTNIVTKYSFDFEREFL